MKLQWWWWCFGDTLEHGLSRDSTIFYTWELIWSRIMGSTWIGETSAYLFLWRLEDGTLQMMERASWTWMGHIESRFDEMISSLWRRRTDGQHIADDSGSTYVAVMFALCGGDNIMDDDMLSRTITISGGGECKIFANSGGWASSATGARARRAHIGATGEQTCDERVLHMRRRLGHATTLEWWNEVYMRWDIDLQADLQGLFDGRINVSLGVGFTSCTPHTLIQPCVYMWWTQGSFWHQSTRISFYAKDRG